MNWIGILFVLTIVVLIFGYLIFEKDEAVLALVPDDHYPISLEDIISFDGFRWNEWPTDEKEVLQPQLAYLGYTNIRWEMGEADSFGPLTRICIATDQDGEKVRFIYG
jgi:hypothetical protein